MTKEKENEYRRRRYKESEEIRNKKHEYYMKNRERILSKELTPEQKARKAEYQRRYRAETYSQTIEIRRKEEHERYLLKKRRFLASILNRGNKEECKEATC